MPRETPARRLRDDDRGLLDRRMEVGGIST
jgi:hypothetical protein